MNVFNLEKAYTAVGLLFHLMGLPFLGSLGLQGPLSRVKREPRGVRDQESDIQKLIVYIIIICGFLYVFIN